MRLVGLQAGVLGLVMLAVACGGENDQQLSKAEYEQKIRSVYGDVRAAFQTVGVDAQTLQEVARQIQTAQTELRDAAEELERLEPPAAVEEPNEELVEGMQAYADDLERLREAAERGDSALVSTLRAAIAESESIHQMAEAAEEMIQRGYDLGPLQPE